jgi:L-lactate utilization protein LutC
MKDYKQIVNDKQIQATIEALNSHNITASVVENAQAAKLKVLELIPDKSEVFTMSSDTLEASGIASAINTTGKYNSVREKLNSLDREKDSDEMRRLGAAPQVAVGSANAVTTDGKLVIVSNTGSQLPAYAYGAEKVIFVVGAQKIVTDLSEAMKRIESYVLPLESTRVQKAYGMPSSEIKKWLIIENEANPTRIEVIIINESIGY